MSTATSCRIQVVADLSPKPATNSTVSATVDFVGDLSPVSATVDFVANVYGALLFDDKQPVKTQFITISETANKVQSKYFCTKFISHVQNVNHQYAFRRLRKPFGLIASLIVHSRSAVVHFYRASAY